MPLADDIREKIVLALTGTTREQCRGALMDGEKRCAQGVLIGDLYGCDLYKGGVALIRYLDDVPAKLRLDMQQANDAGATFDEIAKLVKEWEG